MGPFLLSGPSLLTKEQSHHQDKEAIQAIVIAGCRVQFNWVHYDMLQYDYRHDWIHPDAVTAHYACMRG